MPSALPTNGIERRAEEREARAEAREVRSFDMRIALDAIGEVGARNDARLRELATEIREDRKDTQKLLTELIQLSVTLNKQNSYLIMSIIGFVLTSLLVLSGYAGSVDLPFIHFGSP